MEGHNLGQMKEVLSKTEITSEDSADRGHIEDKVQVRTEFESDYRKHTGHK